MTLGEIVGVLVRKIVVDVMSNNKLSILTTAFDTAKDGLKNSVRSATHEVRSMTSHGFANITNTIVPTRSLVHPCASRLRCWDWEIWGGDACSMRC